MPNLKPKRPRTAAQRAASRRNAFRHGRYAKSLSTAERASAAARKIQRERHDVTAAVVAAMHGDPTDWRTLVTSDGMASLALNYREAQSEIARHGLVVTEKIVAGDQVVGEKRVLNAAFDAVHKLAPRLGLDSASQMLDPASRGQSARDALDIMRAKRDLELVESSRQRRALVDAKIKQLTAKTETP